jgi:hypothetical protein
VTQGISFGGDYVESGTEGVGRVVERHLISSLGGEKREKEKLIKGKETSRLVCLPSKLIDAWIGSIARIITCLEGGARRCTAAITSSGHADKKKKNKIFLQDSLFVSR